MEKSFFELKKPCRECFGLLVKGFLIFFCYLKKSILLFRFGKKSLPFGIFQKGLLKNDENFKKIHFLCQWKKAFLV